MANIANEFAIHAKPACGPADLPTNGCIDGVRRAQALIRSG